MPRVPRSRHACHDGSARAAVAAPRSAGDGCWQLRNAIGLVIGERPAAATVNDSCATSATATAATAVVADLAEAARNGSSSSCCC